MASMPLTVLVVDDEEGFRHILQVVLQRAGYAVAQAKNAAEASLMIAESEPALIILDDMMPGMSGSELCTQLKATEHLRHIPVLMHSANPKLHNPSFVESIGADGVLMKPCSPRDIVAAVGQFLQATA
jgi:two-component system, OmpR family, phosphate regulon response regulator PhoB